MERFADCGWMPMMGIGFLGMVVVWALLVAGLIVLGKWLWGQGTMTRDVSALDILRKRYARGEINKQEFESMKRDLMA